MYHIDVFGFSRQNSILESVGEVTISKMTFRFFLRKINEYHPGGNHEKMSKFSVSWLGVKSPCIYTSYILPQSGKGRQGRGL